MRLVSAAAVALFIAAAGRADDWQQWRGPNRDGVWNETGTSETFPREGLKARWRAPVGPGWSSPVIAQGRVYVTDAQLLRPKAKERVLCFSEATGKPLWTYAFEVTYPDWAFRPGEEAGPSATPIVEAGRIFALGGNGDVHCLDAVKGAPLWQKSLQKQYEIQELICRASPLIDGDLLILFVGGKPGACVIALDKKSGKEVWKALDEPVTNSSPIIIAAGGKRQLIVWTQESVTSLDPATGKTFWRERFISNNNDAVSSPVFHKNFLLIGGLMFKLDPHKPAASVLWPETKALSRAILSHTSTAIIQSGCVFSAKSSGEFVCLEASTGKQLWKNDQVTDLKRGASIHLTPQGDSVFLYTDKGELIRAKLTPQGYQEMGRARVLEPVYPFAGRKVAWSPPAYANRQIFARNEKELICAPLGAKK